MVDDGVSSVFIMAARIVFAFLFIGGARAAIARRRVQPPPEGVPPIYSNPEGYMPTAGDWDGGRTIRNRLGYTLLPCGADRQIIPAPCCLCGAIVMAVEKGLNATKENYATATRWRIDEKAGAQVPFARSELRIGEVLDGVCEDVPIAMPKRDTRVKLMTRALRKACDDFVELFYDEISEKLFNNFRGSALADICVDVVGACQPHEVAGQLEHEEEVAKEQRRRQRAAAASDEL